MQNYPILLITTENYVPFAACLMTSIIHNTNKIVGGQDKPYCFYVLSDSLCATTQEKLLRLQFKLSAIYPCEIFIHLCKDTKFSAKQLPALNGNYVAYYRLFFEKFFPQTAQKVLYLDIDMCVLGDLREIFTMDLGDEICGVVLDFYSANRRLMPKCPTFPILNLSQSYFNSGLLLIDLEKWRMQNIESQIAQSLDSYYFKEHDQSILNFILQDKVKILPLQWNLLVYHYANSKARDEGKKYNVSYTRKELQCALENPKILHYYLDYKPWRDDKIYVDTKGEFLGKYWWDIAQKTPVFAEELMQLKESASCAKSFQAALGFLLLKFARFGLYFLLPILSYWAMKKGLNHQASQEIPRGDYNLSIEIGKEAIKAYNKGKGRLLTLPFRILNLQKRFQLARKRLEYL